MLLKDFFLNFPDENSCVDFFKKVRLSLGIKCPKCGSGEFNWLDGRKDFQCNKCGYRIPLTKGTVMEKSHIPLYNWFLTAHLMTSFKQVLSAKEVQYQLEMKSYPPVWLMMMKYRDIMGKRDAMYTLSDEVELDVSFFPTSTMEGLDSEHPGSYVIKTQNTPVLVMAESKSIDDRLREYLSDVTDNERINKASKLLDKVSHMSVKKSIYYIKMFAMHNQQFDTIEPFVSRSISSEAKVFTDGGTNLKRLKILDLIHEPHQETEYDIHEVVKKVLPWVHIVTGECRNAIEAIHNEVDERFLQLYLNEYCWKFNRRYFRDSKDPKYDLFYRLIKLAATYTSDIKWRNYKVNI